MSNRVHYYHRRQIKKQVDLQMWFKNIMVFMLGFATALILVIVNTYNHKTPLERTINDMQRTCEASSQVFDGNLEAACGELIDRVEARGYKVYSNNGRFWTEYTR